MTTIIQGDELRTIRFGQKVDKAATTVPQNTTADLFTISGGRVLVLGVVGEVTTVVGGTSPTLKLTANPTTGTDVDLCTATAISADEVGTLYAVDGVGNALEVGSSGAVESTAKPIVVAAGAINMSTAAADATGAIKWSLLYVPLDDGASVAAA